MTQVRITQTPSAMVLAAAVLAAMVLVGAAWTRFAAAAAAVPDKNAYQAPEVAARTVPPIETLNGCLAAADEGISGKWSSNWGPMQIRCGSRDEDGIYPVTGSWVQGPACLARSSAERLTRNRACFAFASTNLGTTRKARPSCNERKTDRSQEPGSSTAAAAVFGR